MSQNLTLGYCNPISLGVLGRLIIKGGGIFLGTRVIKEKCFGTTTQNVSKKQIKANTHYI